MEVPGKNLELGRDSFLFSGPVVWNFCLNQIAPESDNIDESVKEGSQNIDRATQKHCRKFHLSKEQLYEQ